ncbi:MAG: DEAD/DEAH box helicase [Planctomycetota bacterium]
MTKATIRERLAHLSPAKARKRLGPNGAALLRKGGALAADAEFEWRGDALEITVGRAVVVLTSDASAPLGLGLSCSDCADPSVHLGGALQFVLNEKVALGLAEPPAEPEVEPLSEAELVERAIEERRERAAAEKMVLRAQDPDHPWTDYDVQSRASGRTYRVALRGEEIGDSYCSCPDFRKNTLGTCKHLLYALDRVRKRFGAERLRRSRVRRRRTSIHLQYGEEVELRVATAQRLEPWAADRLAPFADGPVTDVRGLVRALAELEAAGESVVVHPDAEEWIDSRLVQSKLERVAAKIRQDPDAHPLREELLRVDLRPYQLDGIAFAVGARRAILADDMGLGKTIQGIGVAELFARTVGIERVLIVCPASVKGQWAVEIERFTGRDAQVVLGGPEDRADQYGAAFYTVCNYEQVLRDGPAIEEAGFDFLVLDEAQRIKNWEARTTAAVKSIRTRFALALTGTPLENRLDELYSVVEFVDERRLAPAFRFYNRHRVLDERGRVVGYRDLAALREALAPILLRRTRDQVLDELPPRSTEVIRIEPTVEQSELHRVHSNTVATIASKSYLTEMDVLRLQRALLMCRMAADSAALLGPDEPEASSKLAALDDLLRGLLAEPDRKILVFSEWTRMLDRIESLVEAMGEVGLRLDGSVPQAKRRALVQRFDEDPDARLLLLSNAGTTGLNLQSADTVVNVDVPWNPAVLEQRIGRAHRMGQKRPVQVYVLVTTETIEESMLGTLAMKDGLFQAILDPDSDVDSFDTGDRMADLRARLEVLLEAKPEETAPDPAVAPPAAPTEESEGLAEATGGLVASALDVLARLVPAPPHTADDTSPAADAAAEALRRHVQRDQVGRPTLSITLADDEALETLARNFARIAAAGLGAVEAESRS